MINSDYIQSKPGSREYLLIKQLEQPDQFCGMLLIPAFNDHLKNVNSIKQFLGPPKNIKDSLILTYN